MNGNREMALIDESALLEKMRQGEEAAFESLFNHYWLPLYKTAYRRLNDQQESEDIVQEVLASIWQRRTTITPDTSGSIRSYLFTALRYRIISFYAQVKTERFQGEVLERLLRLQEDHQFSRLITRELHTLIQAELGAMPDNMKKAYHLTRNDHYSIREVADILNLSEQTVKNLITTSSRKLKEAIERYYSTESSGTVATIILLALASQHGQ